MVSKHMRVDVRSSDDLANKGWTFRRRYKDIVSHCQYKVALHYGCTEDYDDLLPMGSFLLSPTIINLQINIFSLPTGKQVTCASAGIHTKNTYRNGVFG